MGIKYDLRTIQYRIAFENLTSAKVKDCFLSDKLVVIVNEGELGKVLGRHGKNIKRIANVLKKNLKVIEFSNDLKKFIENIIYPIKAKNIVVQDELVSIAVDGVSEKGKLIGRNSKNINETKQLVSNYFKIKDIKII